jgi:signal peptidase I
MYERKFIAKEYFMDTPHQPIQHESLGRKFWLFIVDTAQTVLFAAGIFLVIYIFLFRPFQVSGDSMFSSFHNREYILTNLIGLRFGEPQRGDVIVFKSPTDPDKDFIKRIIAIPGDTMSIKDGYVYVNDKKIDESKYLDPGVKTYGGSFVHEDEKVKVKAGQYIVMGDNRTNSSDSREWGFLSRDAIIGKSFLVYWPFNHFHVVNNPFEK